MLVGGRLQTQPQTLLIFAYSIQTMCYVLCWNPLDLTHHSKTQHTCYILKHSKTKLKPLPHTLASVCQHVTFTQMILFPLHGAHGVWHRIPQYAHTFPTITLWSQCSPWFLDAEHVGTLLSKHKHVANLTMKARWLSALVGSSWLHKSYVHYPQVAYCCIESEKKKRRCHHL